MCYLAIRNTRNKVLSVTRTTQPDHLIIRVYYSHTPPQTSRRPKHSAKCLTLGDGSAFVRMSATMLAVGQ